jgi:hypothetical protein
MQSKYGAISDYVLTGTRTLTVLKLEWPMILLLKALVRDGVVEVKH